MCVLSCTEADAAPTVRTLCSGLEISRIALFNKFHISEASLYPCITAILMHVWVSSEESLGPFSYVFNFTLNPAGIHWVAAQSRA